MKKKDIENKIKGFWNNTANLSMIIMAGHISKTLFKNGDIRYFIDMKCIDCGHELYGFYEKHIDINKCPECLGDKIRTFNPDIE